MQKEEHVVEVEGRYHADIVSKRRILQGALFKDKIKRRDTYYDTHDLRLARKGIYLITKNGEFELKVPEDKEDARKGSGFEEEHNEEKIRRHLDLPKAGDLSDLLTRNGYLPFCRFMLVRDRYKYGDLRIDIDHTHFPSLFRYDVAEVEIKTDRSKKKEAETMIEDFAGQRSLKTARGKLFEFLHRTRKKDYDMLCEILGIDDSIFQ